ncbi:hypothetical protein CBR_g37912 [Chara braunii]|uniref:Uncharacterized protein n=1 Tax=Chara braunii TaxID=69332 RepID=A0A388LP82_CHABU|nr:hypothetical protein CBR_g37912 [Chara braunii]|eukprot:GBG84035.1 hypothetical protein CBR_g37912 [Chara braunii]
MGVVKAGVADRPAVEVEIEAVEVGVADGPAVEVEVEEVEVGVGVRRGGRGGRLEPDVEVGIMVVTTWMEGAQCLSHVIYLAGEAGDGGGEGGLEGTNGVLHGLHHVVKAVYGCSVNGGHVDGGGTVLHVEGEAGGKEVDVAVEAAAAAAFSAAQAAARREVLVRRGMKEKKMCEFCRFFWY